MLGFVAPSLAQRPVCVSSAFPMQAVGASIYRGWSELLPSDVELCPIQLPGREGRLREAPFDDLSHLIEALLPIVRPYLDRPFALYGHSMGTLMTIVNSLNRYQYLRQMELSRADAMH